MGIDLLNSSQTSLNQAGDMDDDDICPICEDECTCGSARLGEVDSPKPLFAQIVNQHHSPRYGSAAEEKAFNMASAAKKSTKKSKAVASKPKSKKPRKSKGPKDKSLISRLVNVMGNTQSPVSREDEVEELDDTALYPFTGDGSKALSSDSDSDNSGMFVAASSFAQNDTASHAALAQAMHIAKNKKRQPAKPTSKPTSWQKKKIQEAHRVRATDVKPKIYEVDAAVIRGREKHVSPARRRAMSPKLLAESTDDEFINITDVTSDGSMAGGISETEFDQHKSGLDANVWSDSRVFDDNDEEDIEKEDAAYLVSMQKDGYSSSSLSDLDEAQMEIIRGSSFDSDLDSGEESDSESRDYDARSKLHIRRKYRHHVARNRNNRFKLKNRLGSSDSEPEEELTFRTAKTASEHALVEYGGSEDDREDELLKLHLEQLHAVRNVMQECPGTLLEYGAVASASDMSDQSSIVFTYVSHGSDSDDLSDDLMEGWATDARKRWKEADGTSSDSSVNESKIDKVRLKEDDDDQSKLYSSDSYDEFYTRSAFLDMASDDVDVEEDDYMAELDLDGASLALGVALSMEQQGYSKEDAAAAAAVAAAAYPATSASGSRAGEILDAPVQTTITASMNANGEADPIDGIVSIKSSNNRSGASQITTGAHTPFASSDWRVAAAAAAAAAYLDSSKSPALSYVLPKDLNEARSPRVAMAPPESAGAEEAVVTSSASDVVPANEEPGRFAIQRNSSGIFEASSQRRSSASASNAFTSQLPNSSFYKPLSSICTPTQSTTPGTMPQTTATRMSCTAPTTGIPLVSLSEVSAALTALTSEGSCLTPITATAEPTTPLKRKSSLGNSHTSAESEDKRVRHEDSSGLLQTSSLDISSLLASTQPANAALSMGTGTPMHNAYGFGPNGLVGDDDWLLTMDQLVDTDALMTKSPPPSPAEGAGAIADISGHMSPISGNQRRAASATSDLFARWDRIPVNIFRRSRALASSSRRSLATQSDTPGAMSSLAMTAIKSSRQRRALVNSTLLTQHTLPAEAALQQHAMKLALRGDRRSMRRSDSASMLGIQMSPPAPPPTPLSSRVLSHTSAPGAAAPSMLNLSQEGTGYHQPKPTLSAHQPKHSHVNRQATAMGVSEALSHASNAKRIVGNNSHPDDNTGDESDTAYAFEWLEDEEDLSLFTMPYDEAEDQQPSLTMLLASSSPMMMPFKSRVDDASKKSL
ncbi:hypothetical protein IWW40_003701 [Coemansia sp. RSA 1250]|nr:hypothetical protein IWW40_003701 [Coemansia sp. RSA 1250]